MTLPKLYAASRHNLKATPFLSLEEHRYIFARISGKAYGIHIFCNTLAEMKNNLIDECFTLEI